MNSSSFNNSTLIKRMILIDGANFMHSVRLINPHISHTFDDRPDALPLALYMIDLIRQGYLVKVCLLRKHNEEKIANYYALKVLIDANLAIESKIDGKEKDDQCLLDICRNYGAVIISNDRYNNHFDYFDVPTSRFIKFEAIAPSLDVKMLNNSDNFKSPSACFQLKSPESAFMVDLNSAEASIVQKTYKRFKYPNEHEMDLLNAFRDYIYDRTYMCMYMELPTKEHFIQNISEFPNNFGNYFQLWNEYIQKNKRY